VEHGIGCRQMRRRAFLGLAAGGVALFRLSPVMAKRFTDAAGRKVDLPDRVERVFAAGPPASLILYMVAPEKMLGWARAPSAKARAFLPQRYAALPETGRLTGRGNTVRLEDLVRLAPDLILDVGSTTPTYVSLADEVERRTHIPEVLIGGRLADTPETLRRVGDVVGAMSRAEALARYAESMLATIHRGVAQIAADRRPSIYVARGPRGLQSAVRGSLGSEVVDLLGARNVIAGDAGGRAIVDVSAEAILARQPDVILVLDRRFRAGIGNDPVWREARAVRQGRVHFVPDLPFSWLDEPPAPNRLLGLLWLGRLLYPAVLAGDIEADTRRFYELFYHQAPSGAQLKALLADPPG
jgi:iron complex transport system substrate-binding protein